MAYQYIMDDDENENFELSLPSVSSYQSSSLTGSYLSDDAYYLDDPASPHSPAQMVYEEEHIDEYIPTPPSSAPVTFPPNMYNQHMLFVLQRSRYEFGDLSPIQELPELIYEAVNLMDFERCMAVEKRRIRTIRYKRINHNWPGDCDWSSGDGDSNRINDFYSHSSTASKRSSTGSCDDRKLVSVKRRKRNSLRKCLKWAFACIP